MDHRLEFEHTPGTLSEDSVDQMLVLAERLRAENGGVLDESAIQAVAEATGAPVDYVRLAVKLRADKQKTSLAANLRAQFLTLEPAMRRYVITGVFAAFFALLSTLELKFSTGENSYGIFGMLALIALTGGLYNVCVSRDSKTAAVCGALFGGGYYAMNAIFRALLVVHGRIDPILLIPFTLGGAVSGLLLHRIVSQYRGKLGLKDPVKERQDLLRQLVDLQEKLTSGEQSMTFLSVDIVGSTRMKEKSDPLNVEFTFNEYHQFIERVTRKHSGRVHSTAGDGVTCAFDHAQQAFAAAKNMQTEILELNTFRNKIGMPIVLRVGLHSGTVVAPNADDIKSVNFAHVIDIAAHIQKACPPGGVAVSDTAVAYLAGGAAAVGTQKVQAQGIEGTIWLPRKAGANPSTQTPPPIPEQS